MFTGSLGRRDYVVQRSFVRLEKAELRTLEELIIVGINRILTRSYELSLGILFNLLARSKSLADGVNYFLALTLLNVSYTGGQPADLLTYPTLRPLLEGGGDSLCNEVLSLLSGGE